MNSTYKVGGGSLGYPLNDHLTPPNAGRDFIHNTRMKISPGPQCYLTMTKIEYRLPEFLNWFEDSLPDVGQLTTRIWTNGDDLCSAFDDSLFDEM